MGFTICWSQGRVTQIMDAMGVCMTLITGTERALLVDTGYGLEDVAAFVRTLTDLPLTVLLTHGHHDHALGSMWFDHVQTLDTETYATYTSPVWREHVMTSAREKKIPIPDGYADRRVPIPDTVNQMWIDLGGIHAQIVPCPGHTPGSLMVRIPEQQLLLTGDNWNPCTWLWFPEALPIGKYRDNMLEAMRLNFQQVLCSHSAGCFPRDAVDDFLASLQDDVIQSARPSPEGERMGIDTGRIDTSSGFIVFDRKKVEGSL